MRHTLLLLVVTALFLTACAPALAKASQPPTPNTSATLSAIVSATLSAVEVGVPPTAFPEPSATPTENPPSPASPVREDLARTDEQGAVIVDVIPENLSNPTGTIIFQVGMNTHSVDLSMDLAKESELITDTGLTVSPLSWDGMAGGHHVSGRLVFPAEVDGKNTLEGVRVLTLIIKNVDAPERTFVWNLEP